MKYDSGETLEDLSRCIFIALPKNPGAKKFEFHRIIILMSHIAKLIRILMNIEHRRINENRTETVRVR